MSPNDSSRDSMEMKESEYLDFMNVCGGLFSVIPSHRFLFPVVGRYEVCIDYPESTNDIRFFAELNLT